MGLKDKLFGNGTKTSITVLMFLGLLFLAFPIAKIFGYDASKYVMTICLLGGGIVLIAQSEIKKRVAKGGWKSLHTISLVIGLIAIFGGLFNWAGIIVMNNIFVGIAILAFINLIAEGFY